MVPASMHVLVMGIAGSGKSTLAGGLAERLQLQLAEGDHFHPEANIAKLAAGMPLTHDDRMPWLRELDAWLRFAAARGESTVLACSALRHGYRQLLREAAPGLLVIHLDGPVEVAESRLKSHPDPLVPRESVTHQLEVLEPLRSDEMGITLDFSRPAEDLLHEATGWLSRQGSD